MPPPAAARAATAAAVSLQRGSAWPAAQDASARRRRSGASAIMSASAAASAAASPGGDLDGGRVRHGLGRGAAGRGDDRQAARHRLGQHHAVALVERRRDEDVGAVHRAAASVASSTRAGERDAVREAFGRDERRERASAACGARSSRAGDGEPPLEIRQPGKRPHQDVVALARRDRADGKEPHRRSRCPVARGAGSVPGLGDA